MNVTIVKYIRIDITGYHTATYRTANGAALSLSGVVARRLRDRFLGPFNGRRPFCSDVDHVQVRSRRTESFARVQAKEYRRLLPILEKAL